jgi:tRNA(Arg) A34 adenosine deaminase TadA
MMKLYANKVNRPESCFLHAEIAALAALSHNDRQKAYKISIARTLKNNQTGLAAPCPICQLALKDAGIKVVEYTM